MKQRHFLKIILLALTFLPFYFLTARAATEQASLSGMVKVTANTSPGRCIRPDRMLICRERTSVIQLETDDSRLAGEALFVFDSITSRMSKTGRYQGKIQLDNEGGSWLGTWKGSTSVQGNTRFTAEARGSGGYEGLVARLFLERAGTNWWEPMTVKGVIYSERSPTRRR